MAKVGPCRPLRWSNTLAVFFALQLACVASLYPQDDPSARGVRARARAYYDRESFDPNASAGLFIGVRKFFDGEGNPSKGIDEVPYAVDDAVDLAHLFAADLGLIAPERITLALSGDPQKSDSKRMLRELREAGATVRSATAFNLLELLREVPRQAGAGGILVVSAATHGFDEGGLSWLLAQDSRRPDLVRTSVSGADLLVNVGRSPAPRRIVFLDACREQLGGDESRGLSADPVSTQLSAEIGRSVGLAVLMATTAGGFSYDDHTRKNGVFTAAILDALQGAAAVDHRGLVTLETVKDFANDRVQTWVKNNRPEHIGRSQGVTAHFEGNAGEIPLREDEDARREVEAKLATHAALLRFLEEQEPALPQITLKMVQVVEEDLDRLPFAESNRLVSELETFAAGGAEGAAARATRFERIFAEWLEVRPPVEQARPAVGPEEVQTPRAGRGPKGATVPPEQAIRDVIRAYEGALQDLDWDRIKAVFPDFTMEEFQQYMDLLDLKMSIEVEPDGVRVKGSEAFVRVKLRRYQGSDPVGLEYTLELRERAWQIVGKRRI